MTTGYIAGDYCIDTLQNWASYVQSNFIFQSTVGYLTGALTSAAPSPVYLNRGIQVSLNNTTVVIYDSVSLYTYMTIPISYVPSCTKQTSMSFEPLALSNTSYLTISEINALIPSGLLIIALAWVFSLLRKQLGK